MWQPWLRSSGHLLSPPCEGAHQPAGAMKPVSSPASDLAPVYLPVQWSHLSLPYSQGFAESAVQKSTVFSDRKPTIKLLAIK